MSIREPSKKLLENVVGGTGTRVVVPTYQRSFSWSKDEAKDLYDDLRRFEGRFPDEQVESQEYFLGSIVAVRDGKELRLLDGQQRCATLTILLSSIRDLLEETDPERARELHWALIQERPKPSKQPQDRLQLSVYDREFFHGFIQTFPRDADQSPSKASHKSIAKVRDYFDAQLRSDLEQLTPAEQFNLLMRLWTVISGSLVFVLVETDTEDDATEVFEVLNERGVGLSTIDLLRNFLIGNAGNHEEREQISDSWAEVFSVSDNPARVQAFLRHYWISRHGDVKARGLYREIKHVLRAEFDEKRDSPTGFSIDLSTSAETYRSLLAPANTSDGDLNVALNAINRLGANPLFPPILACIEQNNEKVTAELARSLISHYVRWTVIGKRESTELEAVVFAVAVKLWNGASVDSAIADLRAATVPDKTFVIDFSSAILGRAGQRHHVLYELEKHLRLVEEKDEVAPDPSELHVEHIYPQTPGKQKYKDHDDWINRIGNLTLLKGRWNSKIKNGDFKKVKKPELAKSVLLLNDWIKVQDAWGKDEINARQISLAKIAPQVWKI